MENYLSDWKEYCEQIGINYERNRYLEEYWQKSQDKMFGFVLKLLI